jgi:alpha-tubulin suppressor-like RCC1 family protein
MRFFEVILVVLILGLSALGEGCATSVRYVDGRFEDGEANDGRFEDGEANDGVDRDGGEAIESSTLCDPAGLEGASCADYGFFTGQIAQTGTCAVDTSACVNLDAIGVGDTWGCAVDGAGGVWCWGTNEVGQLGVGAAADAYAGSDDTYGCNQAPLEVAGLSDVVDLAVSDREGAHVCALRSDGTVWCWGSGRLGQLGIGDPPDRCTVADGVIAPCSRAPVQVAGVVDAIDVATSGAHTCALVADGSVVCWGSNALGELGSGRDHERCDAGGDDLPCSRTPVTASIGDAIGIATGRAHTCVLIADGSVRCVGGNWYRQLGADEGGETCEVDGEAWPCSKEFLTPEGLADVVSLGEGGGLHQCAVTRDGALWCWGSDERGEIGDGPAAANCYSNAFGDSPCRPVPCQISGLPPVAEVSMGRSFTCAAGADGSAWCWGRNDSGQLGLGQDRAGLLFDLPMLLAGLADVVEFATAQERTCALTRDGEAWCWGANLASSLGVGSSEPILRDPARLLHPEAED